ncbi:Malate/lactate/ureidoglycolate dehydrogenase, LDH2 family [Pseudonocardia thermophila]|uniref:Malate/lactate/ureidoglycolate dehydrogenase, LDH2 family n=1 Tax=Pseudonocardia thermophila TaxID=1848 RepID=A0A1M6TFA7_PSETH|nr:Ldh family oxidoreductase [Pseudonocardia thermophila]SHK55653.1 Malate/lactate/ureidoglycolate dehydrogenase, LDH2 family [Pseudonocardia thermophila]
MRLVTADALHEFAASCLRGVGIGAADADVVADVLVHADLRGLDAHGVYRLPAYLKRVVQGMAGGGDAVRVVAGSGAVRRVDGGSALGPIAAVRATDLACDLAREHGIGLVAVGHSTHLGAAGYYALRAAQADLVGIVTSNGPKAVAPIGAAEPFLGTNPLAIGIPLGRHGAFLHDMATGASREQIRRAAAAGEPIEPGIAVDADGNPTIDAAAALMGSVLPAGGAKGSGISLAISLLISMLGGADADADIPLMITDPPQRQNVGHMIVVIDPWRLQDRDTALARVEDVIDRVHALRPAAGVDQVRVPGERAAALARQRAAEGIPVPVKELLRWAESLTALGLAEQAEWARTTAG